MPMVQIKVTPKFKPTPEIIKANPTVRTFTKGQVINSPVVNPRTGQPLVRPTPVGTSGSFLSGAGVARGSIASQGNGTFTSGAGVPRTPSTYLQNYGRGKGTNYNISSTRSTSIPTGSFLAGGGSLVNTGSGARPITPMGTGDPRNFSIPYVPPVISPTSGGGGGGGYGGYGGGGGGGYGYQAPVVTPGIGWDINTALNWRVG